MIFFEFAIIHKLIDNKVSFKSHLSFILSFLKTSSVHTDILKIFEIPKKVCCQNWGKKLSLKDDPS